MYVAESMSANVGVAISGISLKIWDQDRLGDIQLTAILTLTEITNQEIVDGLLVLNKHRIDAKDVGGRGRKLATAEQNRN